MPHLRPTGLFPAIFLYALFIALASSSAAARHSTGSFSLTQSYQLSGRVTDQSGTPLPGSAVEVIDPSGGSAIAGATADAGGNYSLSVPGGVYDVKVTPPGGSGFGTSVALGRNINADTVLDLVLVPNGVLSLSGRILDALGNGVPEQSVRLTPDGGSSLPAVLTDVSGGYSFQVSPGSYHMVVGGHYNSHSLNVPHYYDYYSSTPLALTQSMVMDLPLPLKRVSLHVQDAAGHPVVNVAVSAGGIITRQRLGPAPAVGASYYFNDDPVRTDAAGNAVLWLFPTNPGDASSNYTITATPPEDSQFPITRLELSVQDDISTNFTLPTALILSGKVLDSAGNGVRNQRMSVTPDGGGGQLPGTYTDNDGNYSFRLVPGKYWVFISSGGSPGSLTAPHYYSLSSSSALTLTQNTVMDIPIPAKRVSLHVQDPAGNPVAGAGVNTRGPNTPVLTLGTLPASGTTIYFDSDPAVTDAAGEATMWLFATNPSDTTSSYTLTAVPPAGSDLATTSVPDVTFTTDTHVNITLAAPLTLSGRVLDRFGNGLSGQLVTLTPVGGAQLPASRTDASGGYSFRVSPGDYDIAVAAYDNHDPVNAPHFYQAFGNSPLSLTQSRVMDIPLPVQSVSVHVQDLGGNPLERVALSTQDVNSALINIGSVPAYGQSAYLTTNPTYTDAAGNATMWLFATAPDGDQYSRYAITAVAPPGSPFASFNVQNVSVTSDKSIFVVLQFLHDPPVTNAFVSPPPDAGGNYPDPSTVTLSAGAFGGFDVSATYYSLDGGPTQTYAAPFVVSGSGAHTVKYRSVDSGGVYEVANTLALRISVTATPNPPPSVTINGPTTGAVYSVNTPVNFTGAFTDNPGDTHAALWKFDALTQPGTVNEAGGTVNASYTFTSPGVYAVSLTLTDGGGGTVTANQVGGLDALIVVYDPEGGFVTGGGWINSPAGAFPANPSLTGRANFGFVSKYQKGARLPTGETEFQLKVANLNFHSTSYNWLVVSGARAQYKGSGTINGGGDYGFTLTAVDGQVNGGGGVDKLRLKIYDKASGTIVYDNQMGSPDSSSPSTALGGGSVVIHE
jgi:protocatechuate 3,4-dioxygenase beta subunit